MDGCQRADKALDAEMNKWIDLTYPALALAFHRYWGWGAKRIQNVINETYSAWDECAEGGQNLSAVQMLDDETGIELRCYEDSRSWRECAFLNPDLRNKYTSLNSAQYIKLRQSQKKWMRAQILACVLLGINRRYGFGYERLARLATQIDEIINSYGQDKKKISEAAFAEADFVFKEKENK